MGNLEVFPTASIPYPGAHPLRLTRVFLHTTHNRTRVYALTFSSPTTKPRLTDPTYLPWVQVFHTDLFLTYFF
jgi:hypothetical protein